MIQGTSVSSLQFFCESKIAPKSKVITGKKLQMLIWVSLKHIGVKVKALGAIPNKPPISRVSK